MRRRLPLITAGAFVLVIGTLALLPWWLGPAARSVAGRYGATFERYERVGYGRFTFTGVEYRRGTVRVSVKRVEADTPLLWLWRHMRGRRTPVVATEWAVHVAKPTTPRKPTPSGWLPLRSRLRKIAASLEEWLPQASVGPGVVRWPGGEVRVRAARWSGSVLRTEQLQYRTFAADVTLAFANARDELKLEAATGRDGASARLDSRGRAVSGVLVWWEQPVQIDAQFATQGWLPEQASISADPVRIPGQRLKLANWYEAVAGRVRLNWRVNQFQTDVVLRGEPVPGEAAPPLDVRLSGRGDTRRFTVETLHAVVPGGVADLSSPVTFGRNGRIDGDGAAFTVRLDLAEQPWAAGKGIISGVARVRRELSGAPGMEFQLSAGSLVVRNSAIREARATGRLTWPELHVDQMQLSGEGGDKLAFAGMWHMAEKRVHNAKLVGNLRRATVGGLLPGSVAFEELAVEATARGRPADLEHSGRVRVTGLKAANVRPANAELTWRGRGRVVPSFRADVRSGDVRILAAGAVGGAELQLSELIYFERDAEALRLEAPATVKWAPTVQVEGLRLSGRNAAAHVALAWGNAGKVQVALKGIPARWIRNVVPLRGPDWTVSSAALTGSWDDGPMTYSAAGEILVPVGEGRVATVNLACSGNAGGLRLDALHVKENENSVVNASGIIPLRLAPGQKVVASFMPDGELVLDASTVSHAVFWQQLGEISGIDLGAPRLSANVKGTWSEPRGVVSFQAERATMDPKRFARSLPTLEYVDVYVAADNGGIRLDRFNVQVEGQQVRVSGMLPAPRDAWARLRAEPLAYVRKTGRFRLEVPEAEVTKFSRFLPAALAPAGRIHADVRFDRGALGGFLRLRNAASRPLGPLGVLQNVSADVDFSEFQVNLRRVTATSGGQPVSLTGWVGLPQVRWGRETAVEPQYQVELEGRNLPFVRQAGLLVRGDVALTLKTPPEGAPVISGKVVLRDSLFLTDVRAFLPRGGGGGPSRRPPYFSVDTPPLHTWRLDVEVTGTRFMRVRTPVFGGVASTRFHVGGTLGAPRAIGDATINDGEVFMPFASFEVTQGAVRLTEENPFEPEIFVRGTSRHFGYDLAMEVSGKASAPNISFTSSPALDSDQILLMVMTGAAPSNELSTSLTHRAVQFGAFFGQSLVGSLTGDAARPDRLSIESGEKISQQGNETYSIEYKFGDRWSLTGEYDEFDEYNAGVKWRVAPRRKEE